MYVKIIWFCIFFEICASVQFIDYGKSQKHLEQVYHDLRGTRTTAVSRSYLWLLDLNERAKLCEVLFRADVFVKKRVELVDKSRLDYFYMLPMDQFSSIELHYLRRQNGSKLEVTAVQPAIDMRINFPNLKPRELVLPCLGMTKARRWVEVFISSGFRQDVFFAIERDKLKNLSPLGLIIGTDPTVMSTDQYGLEHFYLEQRRNFECAYPASEDEGDFGKLTPAIIYALVNIVFRSSLMEQKEILFRNRPTDINYTFREQFLSFEELHVDSQCEDTDWGRSGNEHAETELLLDREDKSSSSRGSSGSKGSVWSRVKSAGKTGNKKLLESTSCCPMSPKAMRVSTKEAETIPQDLPMIVNVIEVTAYIGLNWNTPIIYAIGRSYDKQKSVFVFKSTPLKDTLVLFGYLSNVMILN